MKFTTYSDILKFFRHSIIIIIIIIIIISPGKSFTPVLADGLLLETEWQ